MKVYVVFGHTWNVGSDTIGIFSTLEKARDIAEEEADTSFFNEIEVREVSIDCIDRNALMIGTQVHLVGQ